MAIDSPTIKFDKDVLATRKAELMRMKPPVRRRWHHGVQDARQRIELLAFLASQGMIIDIEAPQTWTPAQKSLIDAWLSADYIRYAVAAENSHHRSDLLGTQPETCARIHTCDMLVRMYPTWVGSTHPAILVTGVDDVCSVLTEDATSPLRTIPDIELGQHCSPHNPAQLKLMKQSSFDAYYFRKLLYWYVLRQLRIQSPWLLRGRPLLCAQLAEYERWLDGMTLTVNPTHPWHEEELLLGACLQTTVGILMDADFYHAFERATLPYASEFQAELQPIADDYWQLYDLLVPPAAVEA